MNIEFYILGTLSFAIMGALLYIYGYKRSYNMPKELQKQIGLKLEKKVISFISSHSQGVTLNDVANAIKDVKVGSHFQGYKFSVSDPLIAAEAVLDKLIETNKVKKIKNKNTTKYFLVSEEVK
ncbi:hypothetical protein Thena_1021 [Thermodesulfobium narugense DSM 14796]|uniref:Uncharacterized protein n=1 Tax=Thermodesulfobium narugense DSM 14796 TaxID=747365 RepID=M1E7W7_9BACT|nr:hypothetical protein [Thermodesulfobium narugense]AEE14650.1 hypothetical protein Thena_1021 [Thermodesulfobium narugense DSM 14796]